MKNLLLFILFIPALQCISQQPELIVGAAIEIEESVHEFGEVQQTTYSEYIYCEFTVKNIGTEALIISKCKGSCGCTTPECGQEPILPGESTTIRVRYDSYRVGFFSKSVTIFSNAVNEPETKVWVRGTVIEMEKASEKE